MDSNKAFNRFIQNLIRENPNGPSGSALAKILNYYPGQKDYFGILDDVGFKLGIGFATVPVFKGESDRHLGYDPVLKFYPENVFGENSNGTKSLLYQLEKPLKLNQANERLAKGVIYKIAEIPNLEEILKERFEK